MDDAMLLWDEETDDIEAPSRGAGMQVVGKRDSVALVWALACRGLGNLTTTPGGGGGDW